MTQKSAISNDPTSNEPLYLREGDEVALTIHVAGVQSTITSPTMTMYKEGTSTDLSSTYLTGAMSISGIDSIITKTTTGLKSGSYIWSVSATVDGQVQIVATIPVIVKRRSER